MALFGFFTNPMELMVVALIALLIFGNRLPSVMRSLGRGVVEFKKGVAGIEDEVENAATPKKPPEQKAVDQEAKA
jgi:sec-independent protein translocase protein TatA